uniref:Uncharacterized protein n=1 Tax=Aegilops tauschii subsp. strangulata TaxID=200361 RepID=A0A453T7K4_AEGTS
MEAGGGLEAEQVMSEVHLGCPPRFPGLYLSRFTFSSRPLGKEQPELARHLLCSQVARLTPSLSPWTTTGISFSTGEEGLETEEEEARISCSPCSAASPRRCGASGFRFGRRRCC